MSVPLERVNENAVLNWYNIFDLSISIDQNFQDKREQSWGRREKRIAQNICW